MGPNPKTLFPFLAALFCSQFLQAAPQLRLSQTALGPLPVAAGGNSSASVDAFNAGDGSLNLQVSSSVPWIVPSLGAARDCGFQSRACIPVNLDLRTSTLQRGTSTGVVTVSDPNALDAPQTITVTVAVGGNVPDRADFFLAPNGNSQEVRFNSNSVLSTAVTTQNNVGWLAVGTEGAGSFRFGQTIQYRITATPVSGLGEGSYTGQIAVTGSAVGAENKTIPVTLRVTSQPIAELSSDRLTFRIAQGSAKQVQNLLISNRGLGTLSLSGVSTSSGATWLTAERVANTNVISVTADPSGVSPGTYDATLTITSNAAQGDLTVPVQLQVVAAGAPQLSYNGLVNNATFEGGDFLAQGGIVALFGEQFITGDPQQASALPLANELGGVRVFVNDQPAPVYYASYNQINFQIPYNAALGNAVIRVERGGQTSNRISARTVRTAPRLLRLGIGDYAIAVKQDQSFPIPPTPGINSRRAKIGDTLVFYALGIGPTNPAVESGVASPASPLARGVGNFRVTFGSSNPFGGDTVETTPLFVGLTPGFVGLYQINVTIPADAPHGDAVPVALIGDDGGSNRVTIAIE